jgi:signal transduction histidine kinase
MIQHLKRRLIITLTLLFILFFWFILIAFNYAHYRFNMEQNYQLLYQLDSPHTMNGKENRLGLSPERQRADILERLSLCILFYEDGQFRIGETNQITNYTEDELLDYAEQILTIDKNQGRFQNFLYLKKADNGQKPDTPSSLESSGQILYLLDISFTMERIQKMTFFSIILGVIGSFLLFFLAFLLATWLIRPTAEAFSKQKQFISDASHELKTPLTVIGANAELLESEIGQNKWLGYIHSETRRMGRLVNDLLSLARLENSRENPVFSPFSLSHAAVSILLPFESVAFEQGIYLDINIPEGIQMNGSEEQIKQVISILMDNALQHTKPNGSVKATLTSTHTFFHNEPRLKLTVSNTGDPIPPEEQKLIFDRFYRSDSSRERSSGHYGLGLAIAKAITEQHHGTISVTCENGWTSFHLEFPAI